MFQAATSQSGKQLHVPRLYIILLGISNSQLIGSHTMKRVCLKLKRDVLESQINLFLCCFHSFVSTCLFGPTLTLGDIWSLSRIRKSLVKMWMLTYMYQAVIEVSILQLFIIYIHTLIWRACTITQTFPSRESYLPDNAISIPNAYVLANFNIKHAKVCAAKKSLRPIITLSVRPSVHWSLLQRE